MPHLTADPVHSVRRLARTLGLAVLILAAAGRAVSVAATRGHGGAVVSAEADATEIGLRILELGGNAVDAAVATALTLAVVHPEAGNLGGGGFAVVKLGDEIATLDFRETAPAAASSDLFVDETGRPIPGASLVGPRAAGVPGTPKGLWALHARFGHLAWATVVMPAASLARDGFRISERTHESLVRLAGELERFPESRAVWLPDGRPPAAGQRMRIPALARTLASYAAEGPPAVTAGAAALAIERVSDLHGGILTAHDLEAYEPLWRPVLRFEAFGWSFASMGLPSSGGIILGQSLAYLEALDWQEMTPLGAARLHLLAEVLRRCFADRYLLGDPATTLASAAELLADSWLQERLSSIDLERATSSQTVASRPPRLPGESDDTTHLSVIDRQGNVVSLTTTLNTEFGCKLLVPELGFFLNNEMDDFTAAPGLPNEFGLIQGEANAVGAGKRMLSSMSPTIAWRGSEILALGGRGGSRIPTATLQVLLGLIVDNDPLQTAVDRPRIHHQWLPDILRAEAGAWSPETRLELERMGHLTETWTKDAKVNVVRRLANGTVEAAGDSRGPAVAGVIDPLP